MRLAPTLLLLSLAACVEHEPRIAGGWELLPETDLTAPQRAQVETALAARDALFEQLSNALASALDESDPGAAIAVCRDLAPRLAREVGEERGVSIGRTSWKLRNPANSPPDWAQALVAARVEHPSTLVHDDGRLGTLLPIRVASRCLACHGDEAGLSDQVRMALAAAYPDDRATGFADGDLRGWFWIEVP